jgi:hypothetical protein
MLVEVVDPDPNGSAELIAAMYAEPDGEDGGESGEPF